MFRSYGVLLLLTMFACLTASAQYSGFPIKNYPPSDYNASPQCWSVIQDRNGVMYIGTSTFLLEYDGVTFRKIFVQKSAAIRSLAADSKGTIYVASVGNFGYLKDGIHGEKDFVSLLPLVPEKDRGFSDIWKIHVINDTVIFQANERIFIYDQRSIRAVEHKYQFASTSFKYDNSFIVRVKERGLHVLKNGKLQMLKGTEEFAAEAVFGIIEDHNDRSESIILSGTNGFYKYRKGCKEDPSCLRKILPPSDSLIKNAGVLGMQWLNDSIIAINSRTGLYLLNKDLELRDVINKTSGLADEAISYCYTDKNGQTWLALNNGLAKVSLSSPFYYYTEKAGLNGVLESVIRDGCYLYVATTSGVYYGKLNDTLLSRTYLNNRLAFTPFNNIKVEGWTFLRYNGIVYVATSAGVYMLKDNSATRITEDYTSAIAGSSVNDRIYLGQKDGLAVFSAEKGKMKDRLFFFPFSEDILHVAETPPAGSKKGDLWLSTRFRGLIRFTLNPELDPAYQTYDTLNGVPAGNIIPVKKDGRLYFFNSNNGFVYNREKDKGARNDVCFETIPLLSQVGISDPRYWEFQFNKRFSRTQLKELEIFDKAISNILVDKNDVSWLCVGDKLVRFDGRFTAGNNKSFQTAIRSVRAADSILTLGFIKNSAEGSVSLPYSKNNLSFTFATDWFDHEEATMFRWYLRGYDQGWSQWGRISSKEYTNLPEGDYVLEVEALNLFGETGSKASYSFTILPPWYRTYPTYGSYLLLFAGVIFLSVKVSVKQLKKAKDKLENIVTERTAEVVKQKDLIEQKNSLLELAYKDISDSISYASRIQQAILPADSELNSSFKDHFVLYQPRDVVSGDFYWHAATGNDIFFAVADCTGHGVPGAFMSMIGNTLLNEIVLSKKLTDPGEILSQLDKGVKRALKQFGGDVNTNDGMDIALCRKSRLKHELAFAGANRPLFAFSKDGYTEIKADKKPVGGAYHAEGAYTTNIVEVRDGQMVYMFTDGYHDQFGGVNGKKFMVKRLKQLLGEICHLSCEEQRNRLDETLRQWKGDSGQIDDILVVGIRL